MGNQRIGWSGLTVREAMNSPQIKKTSGGPEITETFNVTYANAEAAIKTRGLDFGDDCPVVNGIVTYTDAKLQEINITKAGPKNAILTYVYRIPDPNDPNPPVGQITYESDSNAIEIPIGQNPNATSLNYDKTEKIGKGDWEGIEAALSPQPVFTRSEVIGSFTFSEANIVKNVAKRFSGALMATKGMSSASNNKWLKMQLSISTSGTNFMKTERWQYADNGWKEDIYELATS